MALDAAFVIRAGSGALWVLMGLAILALARGRRENVALGFLALSFGAMFVVNNFAFEAGAGAMAVLWLALLVAGVLGGAALALAWTTEGIPPGPVVAAGLAAGGWQFLVPMGPANAAANAALFEPVAAAFSTDVSGPVFVVVLSLLIGLLVALARAQGRLPAEDPRRPARRLLIYAFGLYLAYSMGANVVAYGWSGYLAQFPLVVAVAGALLLATAAAGGRGERDAALLILAAALAGAAAEAWLEGATSTASSSSGVGLLRVAGVALLAYAVFRRDLLRVPLPRLAATRGATATGALAALFIVAQVGEQFLSAQYGLVMGGVVAGAFLFAAHPIQRAVEGLTGAARPPAPAADPRGAPDERARSAYRKALRLALHDGAMTREEERHLADLADGLGLSYKESLALRDEVERELAPRTAGDDVSRGGR